MKSIKKKMILTVASFCIGLSLSVSPLGVSAARAASNVYNIYIENMTWMEVRDAMANADIALVILDLMLPGTSGLQLCREIRATSSLPIIMLTGHSEKRRVMVARDAGVTEFLAKPISAKGLYQRILNVVANPRPFIKTKHYFGPDRRRNVNASYIGVERRNGGRAEVMQQPSLLDKARSGN